MSDSLIDGRTDRQMTLSIPDVPQLPGITHFVFITQTFKPLAHCTASLAFFQTSPSRSKPVNQGYKRRLFA